MSYFDNKILHKIVNGIFMLIVVVGILVFLINISMVWQSFYSNIIATQAYVGLAKGMANTLILTLGGSLLASFFGLIFCFLYLSQITALKKTGAILVTILRGTPVVMILMILYFCVFTGQAVGAMQVATLGFGLHIGAHMSEVFHSSYCATSKGEVEAARMLGLTKFQAFRYISLPQSWKIAEPAYENLIISLLHWTTLAGYISINELTRLVNALGVRSGNPFYALFLGAVLYMAIAYFVRFLFYLSKKAKGSPNDKNA